MGLTEDLGRGPVALDTCIFIYWIEEHPRYLPLISPLLESADRGERNLITFALTLLEVLVVPYRDRNLGLSERYEQLLTRSRGLRLRDIGRVQLKVAAQLRSIFGIHTPDALQLACATRPAAERSSPMTATFGHSPVCASWSFLRTLPLTAIADAAWCAAIVEPCC